MTEETTATFGFILIDKNDISAQEKSDYITLISNFMNVPLYGYFKENPLDHRYAYILNGDFVNKFNALSSEDQETYLPSNNFANCNVSNDLIKTFAELEAENFFYEDQEG